MSDDRSLRGPQDSSKVSMTENYEVEYWTKKFDCSRQRLQDAVDAVGHGAAAVEEYLRD